MLHICNETSLSRHQVRRDPLWKPSSRLRCNYCKSCIRCWHKPRLTAGRMPDFIRTRPIEDPNLDDLNADEDAFYKPAAKMTDDLDWQ